MRLRWVSMAERAHTSDDRVPFPDEFDPPIRDGDEAAPITAEDIAHVVERLEAGRASGEYTEMRESDLAVLSHLTVEQWREVKQTPSLLPLLVAPTAHA